MDFRTNEVKAGEYLNGVLLPSDDVIYFASGSSGTIDKLRSNLTAGEEQIIVEIVKEIQKAKLEASHEENLNTIFEYPLGSGDTFSIKTKHMAEYNALALYNTNFTYPTVWNGNNGSSVTFNNAVDVQTFHGAAFAAYNTTRIVSYEPKINTVQAININLPSVTMEDAITQIQAIVY